MKYVLGTCLFLIFAGPVAAGDAYFTTGPVFDGMGKVAKVEADMAIPENTKFAVDFDATKPGRIGEINQSLDSAARFMNMHVAAGVKQEDIKIAVVVHGKATFDLTNDSVYGETYEGASNANKSAVQALTAQGVRIILCGQSAARHNVKKSDLLPGVEMALSAMTAHALLQQQGYTLNP